jgi:hypothetical protein
MSKGLWIRLVLAILLALFATWTVYMRTQGEEPLKLLRDQNYIA